jgi:ATP-binding cassette subfamily F protein 3
VQLFLLRDIARQAAIVYGAPNPFLSAAETPAALMPKVRDMLGTFLFRGDDVYKPVSVLSGGEKSRLALLQMLLKPMNLLILDEPTNHLDLHSRDVLLEALRQFIGTIIFVFHDRAFMEALSTKTLELSPAADPASPTRARLFYGNYGYYLEKIASETTVDGSDKNVVVNTAASKSTAKERAQNKQR